MSVSEIETARAERRKRATEILLRAKKIYDVVSPTPLTDEVLKFALTATAEERAKQILWEAMTHFTNEDLVLARQIIDERLGAVPSSGR